MAALGKLVVSLSANIAEFTSAMDKAAYTASNRMEAMTNAAGVASAAIGGALVAGAGVLAHELMRFATAADETVKAAQKIGIGVEELQRLQYAAEMSGVASDTLQSAMSRLARGAADGNDAFAAMGISVRNADGTLKSTNTLMGEVAGKFAQYRDGAEKTALAQELFGRSGADLIPLLNAGSDGLAAMAAEADELGFVFDAKTGRAAEAFNDNLTRMVKVKDGIIAKIAAGMLPMMETLSARMVEAAKNTDFWNGVALVLNGTLKALISAGSILYGVFEFVGKGLASVAAAAVMAARGEFAQAYDILKMGGEDMVAAIQNTVTRTMSIWEDAGQKAETIANAPGGGLTAPIVQAANNADRAAKQLEQAQREIARIIAAAQSDVEKLTVGDDQAALNALRRMGASPEQIAALQAAQVERLKLRAMDKELDEAIRQAAENDRRAAAAKESLRQAGIRVYEETRSPLEKLNIRMTELNDLLQKGAIDWDTYSRAVFKAQDEFDSLGEKGKDTMKELTQVVEAWGSRATDTFLDFAFKGKASFSDLVNSILRDLARMMLQQNVMAPLFNAISGSAGGWLRGLFSFDGGGYTGRGSRSGGLDGKGGFLAMLHPNETVLDHTKGQSGSGGSTNVIVNVNVEGGMEVQSQQGGAALGRVIAAAVKTELINQKRPGGLLAA